ncbi:hypothetical protein BJP36_42580 [Moorena producens JHB]|uniref:Uncharacterized protein n=1 Tax=Moorena producens (strain JHB) TaxID=1454205 RepID=A0A9Q9SSX5_MOOP1|nr:hypothetical protein [Moorena producens]WAN69045.1 hypothetical protein BJP36_42580 [Moorena producens JHB]
MSLFFINPQTIPGSLYFIKISPDSRLPRCAFRWRIKFATGRTAPDSRLPNRTIFNYLL